MMEPIPAEGRVYKFIREPVINIIIISFSVNVLLKTNITTLKHKKVEELSSFQLVQVKYAAIHRWMWTFKEKKKCFLH